LQRALAILRVVEASSDASFDALVIDALKHADPFPAPPAEIVNEEIILAFRP
jgi:outer membrane biosynthesis protein TonB